MLKKTIGIGITAVTLIAGCGLSACSVSPSSSSSNITQPAASKSTAEIADCGWYRVTIGDDFKASSTADRFVSTSGAVFTVAKKNGNTFEAVGEPRQHHGPNGMAWTIIADDGTATCSSELDGGRIEVIVSGTAYDGEIEAFLDAIEIV